MKEKSTDNNTPFAGPPLGPGWVDRYVDDINRRNDAMEQRWGLSRYAWWELDQSSGQLLFFDTNLYVLQLQIQVLGSHSTVNNTWAWAWANPHIRPELTQASICIRDMDCEQLPDDFRIPIVEADGLKWVA